MVICFQTSRTHKKTILKQMVFVEKFKWTWFVNEISRHTNPTSQFMPMQIFNVINLVFRIRKKLPPNLRYFIQSPWCVDSNWLLLAIFSINSMGLNIYESSLSLSSRLFLWKFISIFFYLSGSQHSTRSDAYFLVSLSLNWLCKLTSWGRKREEEKKFFWNEASPFLSTLFAITR